MDFVQNLKLVQQRIQIECCTELQELIKQDKKLDKPGQIDNCFQKACSINMFDGQHISLDDMIDVFTNN